jgi:rubrerythrin
MDKALRELQDLAETISIAIAREKASIALYNDAYRKAISEDAKRVFSLLIEQERAHEASLREQLAEVTAQMELSRSRSKATKE